MALIIGASVLAIGGQILGFFGDIQASGEARTEAGRLRRQEELDRLERQRDKALARFETELTDQASQAFVEGRLEDFERDFGGFRNSLLDFANNLSLADFAGDSLAQFDVAFADINRRLDANLARRGLTSASGVDDPNRRQTEILTARGKADALNTASISLQGARAQAISAAASLDAGISEATRIASERSKLRGDIEAPIAEEPIVQPTVITPKKPKKKTQTISVSSGSNTTISPGFEPGQAKVPDPVIPGVTDIPDDI